jgi:hypothetical protein
MGCEGIARQIQKHIGGEIMRITALAPGGVDPGMLFIGPYRGHNLFWHHHEVVVKEGRVYDVFTGHEGIPIEEFKALWDWRENLHFGF